MKNKDSEAKLELQAMPVSTENKIQNKLQSLIY